MTDYQRFYRNEGDYPQLDGDAFTAPASLIN